MGILNIHKAERSGSRVVVALAAWTGKGKTYTAIQLAYGLANFDVSKVGFIDTENKRGSLNADILEQSTRPTKERFLIGDLVAPFSPQRYIDSIKEFEDAGVDVLIVDSTTHEWEGIGGCQEIAGSDNKYWNKAKEQHKKFMNALLQCDMHVIVCVRAREKVEMKKVNGKTEYEDIGLQPIQEKNFMFEMTASLMMFDEGRRQEVIKCPAALINVLGRKDGYITADDGHMLRKWVDGAIQLDPTVEKFRNRLLSNCEGGEKHILDCWGKTPAEIQKELGQGFLDQIVHSAKAYDQQRKESDVGAEDAAAGDPVGAQIAARAKAGAASRPQTSAAPSASAQPSMPPPTEKAADTATPAAGEAKSTPAQASIDLKAAVSPTTQTTPPARTRKPLDKPIF